MKRRDKRLVGAFWATILLLTMLPGCTLPRTSEVLLTEGEGFSVELRDLSFVDGAEDILTGTLRFTFADGYVHEPTGDWRETLIQRHRPVIECRNRQKDLMIGYVEVQQTGDTVEYVDLYFSETVYAGRNDVLRICFVTAPPLRFYPPER